MIRNETATLSSFMRWSGISLAGGGVLVALVNVVFAPFLLPGTPFELTARSAPFLWRQGLSLVAAELLLFGSVGLYLCHRARGIAGAIAFGMAFIGSSLLAAWEWVDVFVLHDLAVRVPEALTRLEAAKGMNLYDLGALIPVTLFTIGWLALAGWVWWKRELPRRGAALVIAGMFAVPLSTAALGPQWGGALGNCVLGAGLFVLGTCVSSRSSAQEGALVSAAPSGGAVVAGDK